jgi:uroporphyrinogen-III synthase
MRTILITRPEPEATDTAVLCTKLGFDSLISPLTSINYLSVSAVPKTKGIILTSPHALHDAIIPLLDASSVFYVVGQRAAHKASACGFTVALVSNTVRELIALLPPAHSMAYLSGEHITHEFPSSLVTRIITYQAIATRTLTNKAKLALCSPTPPVVLFASTRNVSIFATLVSSIVPLHGLAALCLSPAIADIAKKAGFSSCFTDSAPDMESLLTAYRAADCAN